MVLTTTSASIRARLSRSNATASPPQRAAAASARSGFRLVTRIRPGFRSSRCWRVRSPILPGADDEHGLVGEGVEDVAGDVDGDAGDRELALVHARLFADLLADAQARAEDAMEDRPGRAPRDGRGVGVLDLAEDLPLAQHQALQAGGDPEEVGRPPARRGGRPGGRAKRRRASRGSGRGSRSGRRSSGTPLRLARGVDLDAVAGREDGELGRRGRCGRQGVEPLVEPRARRRPAPRGRGGGASGDRRPGPGASQRPPAAAVVAARRGPSAGAAARRRRGEGQEEEGHHRQHHHPPPPHRRPEPGVQQDGEDDPHDQRADDLRVGPARSRHPSGAGTRDESGPRRSAGRTSAAGRPG